MKKAILWIGLFVSLSAQAFETRPEGITIPAGLSTADFKEFAKKEIRSFVADFNESFLDPQDRLGSRLSAIDAVLSSRDYRRCVSPKFFERLLPGRTQACRKAEEQYNDTVGNPLGNLSDAVEAMARMMDITAKYRVDFASSAAQLRDGDFKGYRQLQVQADFFMSRMTDVQGEFGQLYYQRISVPTVVVLDETNHACSLPADPSASEKRKYFACYLKALRAAYGEKLPGFYADSAGEFTEAADKAIAEVGVFEELGLR